jgi:hypothetical protein
MKLNLNENMVRALARNILFESNERIALHELSMSPEKTGNGNSPVNSNANNKRMGIFDRPGPDKNNSESEEFEETDTDGLPIEHEKYGGQVSYDIPSFTASFKVDNPDKFLEDDFNPSKSTMPSVVAELSKQIDDANVDSYFKKVANLTKQYLKKQS